MYILYLYITIYNAMFVSCKVTFKNKYGIILMLYGTYRVNFSIIIIVFLYSIDSIVYLAYL